MNQRLIVLGGAVGLVTAAACSPPPNGDDLGPTADAAASAGGQAGRGGNSGAAGSGNRAGSGQAAGAAGASAGSGGASAGSGGASAGSGGASAGSGGASAGSGGTTSGAGGSSNKDGGAGPGVTDAAASAGDASAQPKFSFFYTSLDAMRKHSKSQNGFGGDLRFGQKTGIEGADKICQTIADENGGAGKVWRAFLSVVKGPDDKPINAIDRIGEGPWYDRRGRLLAMSKADLVKNPQTRAAGGDATYQGRPQGDKDVVNDLPDETGQGTKRLGDTHDVITGSNTAGKVQNPSDQNSTCMDWTSTTSKGPVQAGHSWPAGSGQNWIQAHPERSCAAGVNLVQNGPGNGSSIGAGGGWGGFYCFALTP